MNAPPVSHHHQRQHITSHGYDTDFQNTSSLQPQRDQNAFMQHHPQNGMAVAGPSRGGPSTPQYDASTNMYNQNSCRPQPPLHTLNPTPTPPSQFPPTPIEPTSGSSTSVSYMGGPPSTQQWLLADHGQGQGQQEGDREMRGASGSLTPPAALSSTPPNLSQAQHGNRPTSSYYRQDGEMFTPSSGGPAPPYLTPAHNSTHIHHHAHTIDSSSMLSGNTASVRPQLASSHSFPGPMYAHTHTHAHAQTHAHGSSMITPPSASASGDIYPISTSASAGTSGYAPATYEYASSNYHFGSMPPPPVPSHSHSTAAGQFITIPMQPPLPHPGHYPHPHHLTYQSHNGHGHNGMMLPTPLQMPTDDWGAYAEWEDDEHPGEWFGANMEVKHRRRTSPEQLKVLEHWFSINPKPDNALREWLAGELGMTKRNVQVWFQNRRAKIKGLQIKERVAMEKAVKDAEEQRTPEGQISASHPPVPIAAMPHPFPRELRERAEMEALARSSELPLPGQPPIQPISGRNLTIPMPGPIPNGGRRVSLANGEAEKIQMWAAKRAATSGMGASPRSPLLGQAAAARRGSIPYPTPLSSSAFMDTATAAGRSVSGPGSSPKFSPLARPMPSTLHLTAIRNNTRRASMPGAPQLLSSGPFTPPRVVSSNYPMAALPGRATRELSPITDNDTEATQSVNTSQPAPFMLSESDFSTTYLTPPSSTYNPSSAAGRSPGSPPTSMSSGSGQIGAYPYPPPASEPYTPIGPLPDASYSFGKNAMFGMGPVQTEEEIKRAQAIYLSMQERGRLGSLASINTWTTDETAGTAEEGDTGSGGEGGFSFDGGRRASAPAELLENLGMLGIGAFANNGGAPLRPSPLGMNNGFTSAQPAHTHLIYTGATGPYNSAGQPQLSIPTAGSGQVDTSPRSGSFLTASPIDMPVAGSMPMSAQTSFNSSTSPASHTSTHSAHSAHSMPNANLNGYTSIQGQGQDHSPYRSMSTGHEYPPASANQVDMSALGFSTSPDPSGFDFGLTTNTNADGEAEGFSIVVPPMTLSVSAPASAYPATMGEQRQSQAALGPAAEIGGKKVLMQQPAPQQGVGLGAEADLSGSGVRERIAA